QQADGVWQSGQNPGSGKSDRDPFRGICPAAAGLNSTVAVGSGASTEIRADTGVGSRRCRILFLADGESLAQPWSAEDLCTQQAQHQCRAETLAAPGLVSARTEMENWFRRPHQHTQTKARVAPLSVSRIPRHAAMGRTRSNRRQSDSDGTLSCPADYVASSCSALKS